MLSTSAALNDAHWRCRSTTTHLRRAASRRTRSCAADAAERFAAENGLVELSSGGLLTEQALNELNSSLTAALTEAARAQVKEALILDPRDPDTLVIAATKDGVTHGFLQFAPWGSDGMSLDLMRRSRDAAPGINELLIVEALEQAPRFGIRRVSLNFAMFRSTFERGQKLGAGPLTKLFRGSLVWGNRWFQLESLYTFNAKFEPEWTPRFVVYPRVGDVVRVGFAMGEAEGFLVVPPLRQLFPGRRRAEPAATAREVLAR